MYLETRRIVQATSCKDNILRIMLKISSGRVSNVHRAPIHPCKFCLHREDTLRRLPFIYSFFWIQFRPPLLDDCDRSQSITKDHVRSRIAITINEIFNCGEGQKFPKFCRSLCKNENSQIYTKQRSHLISQSIHCDESFRILRTNEKL